jgi:hypothetical protein
MCTPCFCLKPSSSPGPTMRSIDRKPLNLGIAKLEPRQLAPTVGTTGSGTTDSLAPSSSSTSTSLHLPIYVNKAMAAIAFQAAGSTSSRPICLSQLRTRSSILASRPTYVRRHIAKQRLNRISRVAAAGRESISWVMRFIPGNAHVEGLSI